ncbi:MAG: type II CRISPR RNA-guided endonuclease Cas9 [Paludibacteraceae bacterium]|nr:type II CRISPR RNA-guided endonuclease Cas9 [Paludibacteraceae bacterium]
MKHILGLDLGTNSIGWALIESDEQNQPQKIIKAGSRIVPLTKDDSDQFQKGQAITKNADRTAKRTARKGFDRYQLRRTLLTQFLRQNGMLPSRMDESALILWKLRSDAATDGIKLTLPQLGRVLYHINQKRGYKHAKADVSGDAKQTKYVEAVNQRYVDLQADGKTIGQHFYKALLDGIVHTDTGDYSTFRIKDKVYPRQAYIAEFDKIMSVQKSFYPNILTDELIDTLRNRIIFYQRPLKSCKHLVSLCEFEMKPYKNAQGQIVYSGPKCAPRTSPLAQYCAIWETVNNITLSNKNGETYPFTLQQRKTIVDFLCTHEKLGVSDLQKILGISKKDGWWGGKAIGKGIKGASTFVALQKALENKYDTNLLTFDFHLEDTQYVDTVTGEIIQQVSADIEQQPLYRLWHVVYSVTNEDDLRKALAKQFGITDETVVQNLYHLDFVKPGYANKSHKFIRRILPYLMQGYMYNEACAQVGINHSNSLTKAENANRPLKEQLDLLQKNELRQPIVEKILNQMINIVNAVKNQYGTIDEIRVELARELKMSKDERADADKRNRDNERLNAQLATKISEMGIRPTLSRIRKYKMWEESEHQCFYCGKSISCADFLNGADVEVEHIIPRSILFDDSYSNKVCACRECNHSKGNLTAIEFIESRGEAEVVAFKNRVDEAVKAGRISRTKRDHLLWHKEDIPQDFIDRQLRQSQYIAKKAIEILKDICHDVYATSGNVTDFLRHQWGYDEILHTLNLPKYSAACLTELRESDGKERIKNWSKRIDHRHHAVDALTIAQTSQSVIQRLNTLNASREQFMDEIAQAEATIRHEEKKSLLEKWVQTRPHISVQEATNCVDGILVSFRAGKRVTTPAKRAIYQGSERKIIQIGLQVPRGALTEETIYGKVGDRYVVKYPLNHPSMKVEDIVDPTIRSIVQTRLDAFGGKAKEAFTQPLYSDKAQKMEIKSVRCFTGLQDKSVTPIKFDDKGNPIGYAKLGNNHHIAIYQDKEGKYYESVVSFWNAVERKKYGLPIVIDNPHDAWDIVMNKDLPETFLETLPNDDWQFVTSLQANEMFILGMEDAEFEDAIQEKDYQKLNKYLYRVQKISHCEYTFRYHTETSVDDKYNGEKNMSLSREMKKMYLMKSIGALWNLHPHKVKINILGEISSL